MQNKCANITNEELLSVYSHAKSDYRNALSIEQSVLSFGAGFLTICTAPGFIYYGTIQSWIVFCLMCPFILSLVSGVYFHQKNRSRTYKVYQAHLETAIAKRIPFFPEFELWEKQNSGKLIKKHYFLYFGYFGITVMFPFLFIIIGIVSYLPSEPIWWFAFTFVCVLMLITDVLCWKYLQSMNSLINKPNVFEFPNNF